MNEQIKKDILSLRKKAKFAYVSSVNSEGYPQVKCMFTQKTGDVREHYFSTNTSSKRAEQFLGNPKAAVYLCDEKNFKGALFTGTMEVCTDREIKKKLWHPQDVIYYPKGIDDEDYCVLKFTAQTVNFYHNLKNATIDIEEFY